MQWCQWKFLGGYTLARVGFSGVDVGGAERRKYQGQLGIAGQLLIVVKTVSNVCILLSEAYSGMLHRSLF